MSFTDYGVSDNVFGYTGEGKKDDPYVAASETDLRDILLNNENGSKWVYIAVNKNISVTKKITVSSGRFRIYARGSSRKISRSGDKNASVNNQANPRYCMQLEGKAEIVFGYPNNNHKLILNGNGDKFNNNFRSAGYMYVISSATIDKNCHLTNVKSNEKESGSGAISNIGTLTVNGEVSQCEGKNGGAIASRNGILEVNKDAYIHNCIARTEGGGVYIGSVAKLVMNGGVISECLAKEEGGGIFATGISTTTMLYGGTISNNKASNSGGGVFSGYGAVLYIGKENGNGPIIRDNNAGGSGGGVRCNGGTDVIAGGTASFYGGEIRNNYSGKFGGGISYGPAGGSNISKILVKQINVSSNNCKLNGGGIYISEGVKGNIGKEIQIADCIIEFNKAERTGAGMSIGSSLVMTNTSVSGNTANSYAGGIYVTGSAVLESRDKTRVQQNHTVHDGGGIYVNTDAVFNHKQGNIQNNTCGKNGGGVYVKGRLLLSGNSTISNTNIVYLHKDKYIEIVGILAVKSGYVCLIDSAEKSNGTRLVKVNYGNKTASSELYYQGDSQKELDGEKVSKKFLYNNLKENKLLRPTENVIGYDDSWIILSEKYKVSYLENTDDKVTNMPQPQNKCWHENITIKENKVERKGYRVNEDKHWNSEENGLGKIYFSGSSYSEDKSILLFAQWQIEKILQIIITAKDRYFIKGQKIKLTHDEILKKVRIEDDIKSQCRYPAKIIKIQKENGEILYDGYKDKKEIIKTEEYIDTQLEENYIITIYSEDKKDNISAEAIMKIFVVDVKYETGVVRFISNDYINTLDKKSKWNNELKNELTASINKKEGQEQYHIKYSAEEVKKIKKKVESGNYKIDKSLNWQIIKDF